MTEKKKHSKSKVKWTLEFPDNATGSKLPDIIMRGPSHLSTISPSYASTLSNTRQ